VKQLAGLAGHHAVPYAFRHNDHLSRPDRVDGLTATLILQDDVNGARDEDAHLIGIRMPLAGMAGRPCRIAGDRPIM